MHLQRIPVSATVTRYLVRASLAPGSRLLLVTPDLHVVASWGAGAVEREVCGEWISPHADLEPMVDGMEHRLATPPPPVLRLVDGGAPEASPKMVSRDNG